MEYFDEYVHTQISNFIQPTDILYLACTNISLSQIYTKLLYTNYEFTPDEINKIHTKYYQYIYTIIIFKGYFGYNVLNYLPNLKYVKFIGDNYCQNKIVDCHNFDIDNLDISHVTYNTPRSLFTLNYNGIENPLFKTKIKFEENMEFSKFPDPMYPHFYFHKDLIDNDIVKILNNLDVKFSDQSNKLKIIKLLTNQQPINNGSKVYNENDDKIINLSKFWDYEPLVWYSENICGLDEQIIPSYAMKVLTKNTYIYIKKLKNKFGTNGDLMFDIIFRINGYVDVAKVDGNRRMYFLKLNIVELAFHS